MMASNRFIFVLLLLLVVVSIGTFGYQKIEGFSFIDSLYMTIITITTVGFREVGPLSAQGKLFTIALIMVGVGIVVFAIGLFSDWIIQHVIRIQHHITRKELTAEELLEEGTESEELFNVFGQKELILAVVKPSKKSKLAGTKKIDALRRFGVVVLAVEKNNSRFDVNVPFQKRLKGGSRLLVMGTEAQIRELEKLAK
jgi:membrane protein insertase Oxa1/YidC/SpoIIIJ